MPLRLEHAHQNSFIHLMDNQIRENNASIFEKLPNLAGITTNESFKKNSRMLLTFLAVLFGFNVLLYTRLAPAEIKSLHNGSYKNDFSQSIILAEAGWFDLEGDWEVIDGRLTHNNFLAQNPALIIPLKAELNDVIYFSADLKIGATHDAGGVRFNMESPNHIARSHRVSLIRQGDQTILTGGYYADSLEFSSQFMVPLENEYQPNRQNNLTIVSTQGSYDVYLNGALMVQNIPAIYPPGWHGFSAIGDTTTFEQVEIELKAKLEPELLTRLLEQAKPTNGEIIEAESTSKPSDSIDLIRPADGNLEEIGWLAYAGSWSERNGALIQSDETQADARAIFQTPKGDFHLEITLRHLQDKALGGGGVLFGLKEPDKLEDGYMARFTDDGSGFFYGRYDENEVFEGIGFHPFSPVESIRQTIGVTKTGSQFTVSVNGETIFEGLASSQPESHFGVVSNEAKVVFERALLSPSTAKQAEANETSADSQGALLQFSGDWSMNSGIITQSKPDLADYVASLNQFEQRFKISANISMSADSEPTQLGGGVIFNMPQQESKNGGQIVRFLNGGSEVIWGYFGESGQFIGQSGVGLQLSPKDTHRLEIEVNGSTFSVIVNNDLVATDLPLQQIEGWVGLITFGGPVSFEEVTIEPIQEES